MEEFSEFVFDSKLLISLTSSYTKSAFGGFWIFSINKILIICHSGLSGDNYHPTSEFNCPFFFLTVNSSPFLLLLLKAIFAEAFWLTA